MAHGLKLINLIDGELASYLPRMILRDAPKLWPD